MPLRRGFLIILPLFAQLEQLNEAAFSLLPVVLPASAVKVFQCRLEDLCLLVVHRVEDVHRHGRVRRFLSLKAVRCGELVRHLSSGALQNVSFLAPLDKRRIVPGGALLAPILPLSCILFDALVRTSVLVL